MPQPLRLVLADGGEPYKGVTLDGEGNLYGTSAGIFYGSTVGGGRNDDGTIYKFTP